MRGNSTAQNPTPQERVRVRVCLLAGKQLGSRVKGYHMPCLMLWMIWKMAANTEKMGVSSAHVCSFPAEQEVM